MFEFVITNIKRNIECMQKYQQQKMKHIYYKAGLTLVLVSKLDLKVKQKLLIVGY